MKLILFLSAIVFLACNQFQKAQEKEEVLSEINTRISVKDYSAYHKQALEFIKEKGYNTDYYFLLDYSIHPGKFRFFIYNFNSEKVEDLALVTHGACDVETTNKEKWTQAKFSNAANSHCSSKGKYVLGKRDVSSWGIGIKYWLKGLENTNDNAIDRIVVLHSWDAIPDEETYPDPIALSWGCPAVSDEFMTKLDAKIKASSNAKILMWIID